MCIYICQCIHSELSLKANSLRQFLKKYILYSFIETYFPTNEKPYGRSISLRQQTFYFIKLCKYTHNHKLFFMLSGGVRFHLNIKNIVCAAQKVSHFLFKL